MSTTHSETELADPNDDLIRASADARIKERQEEILRQRRHMIAGLDLGALVQRAVASGQIKPVKPYHTGDPRTTA